MNDRAFSLSFFRYFRALTHYELFVSFRSLNFGCKINRINPLLIIISSKLPANKCYSQITMGVADYCKRQLKTTTFPNLIETASTWLRSLAATYKSNNTTAQC